MTPTNQPDDPPKIFVDPVTTTRISAGRTKSINNIKSPFSVVTTISYVGMFLNIAATLGFGLLTFYAGPGGVGFGIIAILSLPTAIAFLVFALVMSIAEIRFRRRQHIKQRISHVVICVFSGLILLTAAISLTAYGAHTASTRNAHASFCKQKIASGEYVPLNKATDSWKSTDCGEYVQVLKRTEK